MLLVAIIFSLEANVFAQKFPFADLMGTNVRREDPTNRLGIFGFVREYHDWAIDQGDQFSSSIGGPAPDPDYPNNLFRWNKCYQGSTWEKFPDFYTKITDKLQESPSTTKPICSSLHTCLPRLSGTGGNQYQSAAGLSVSKPYWDIAKEFKPIKTSHSLNTTDGTLDLSNIAFVDDPKIPESYKWYADWVTQYSKAFATDMHAGNTAASYKSASSFIGGISFMDTQRGQNKVGYVEIWNEQDKFWFSSRFPLNAVMTYFNPEEYTAMAGMSFDGFSNGSFISGQKGTSTTYNLGFANTMGNTAANKAKYVFGGLFDIGEAQWNYVNNVNQICNGTGAFSTSTARRSGFTTNPVVKFPFDVLNFHHYCDNSVQGIAITGVSPESDNVSETPNTTTKRLKQRLQEIRANAITLFPQIIGTDTTCSKELWLSEFGWDTNLESDQRCEQAGLNQEEVQARWMVRMFLEISAAKWDRGMQFCIRDEDTRTSGFGSPGGARYKSSGVVRHKTTNHTPKLSYWHLSAMQQTLKDYFFAQELQYFDHTTNSFTVNSSWQYETPTGTPRIYLFKKTATNLKNNSLYPTIQSANQDLLAVWTPTSNGSSLTNYRIYFKNFDGTIATSATIITPAQGDVNGVRNVVNIQKDAVRNLFYVQVPLIDEVPRYIILGSNTPDNLPVCPTVVAANNIAVSCDAVSLKWTNPTSGYDKISVYYYQSAYLEAPPVFNLSNPKWKLYTDNLPGTTTQTVISGLDQMSGTYYVVLIPEKNNQIPLNPCVHLVKSASCQGSISSKEITDNNPSTVPVGSTIQANTNAAIVSSLFDYSNLNLCYEKEKSLPNLGGWTGSTTEIEIFLVPKPSTGNPLPTTTFTLNSISFYDQNGDDLFEIFGDDDYDNSTGTNVLLASYFTSAYLQWINIPITHTGPIRRLILKRPGTLPIIHKLLVYGFKNSQTNYQEPGCCGSSTTTSGNTIVVGSTATPPLTTASAAFGANILQSNKEIVVKGAFTFDMASLTLDKCTVFMDETANTFLGSPGNTSTKQLIIKGSTIQGCKNLWKGISIFPSSASISIEPDALGNPSIIRDAEKFLNVQRATSTATTFIKLDGAIFQKNMYGVFINPNTCTGCSKLDVNPASIIKATKFDGTTTQLKPPYTGMTAGTYVPNSVAAIDMEDVADFTVGVVGTNANVFQRSNLGIYARKSNLKVQNSSFKEILTAAPGNGIGILANNLSKLDQTGLGKTTTGTGAVTYPPTFDNVRYGISTSGSSLKVKDNTMQNIVVAGVQTASATVATNDFNYIDNNNINTFNNGISMFINNVKLRVKDNIINNFYDKNIFGIQATGTSSAGVKTYDIRNNFIALKADPTNTSTYGAGIFLNNTNSPNIQGNIVNVNDYTLNYGSGQPLPNIYGILETNGNNGTYCTNSVTGVGNNHAWGIKTESTTGNRYDCNTLSTIGKGLTFFGNCTSTGKIVDNKFNNHTDGLLLQANGANTAQVGIQDHVGNDWTGLGASLVAARFENATQTEIDNNIFKVNNGDASIGFISPSNWFSTTNGTDLMCQAPCGANQINLVGSGGSQTSNQSVQNRGPELLEKGFYRDVILGQNKMENYAPAYAWMIRRNIYRDLVNTYGAEIPEEYKPFMEEQSANSVGQFQDFESKLGTMEYTDNELLSAIFDIETKIETIGKENEVPLKDFQTLTTEKQLHLLENNSMLLPADMGTLWEERIHLFEKLQHLKIDRGHELLSQNDAIPISVDFEKYEQQTNNYQIRLNMGLENEIAPEDSTQIDFIAGLCPFEGGFAVYKARSIFTRLYGKYKPEWFECKEIIEARQEDQPKSEKAKSTKFDFDILPNPAKDAFYIRLNESDNSAVKLRIMDAKGQVILSKAVIEAYQRIETSNFIPGIYFVEIVNSKGANAHHKILIQK
jgi:hypothetical protein